MRKFLLLTLLTILGGASFVKARTNIDMSTATASTGATWTSGTNTFEWTAENQYVVIPGLSGDLTGCYLDFTISNACRIDIVFTDETEKKGDWNGYGRFGSGGSKTQDLGFMAGAKIDQVKEVRIASTSASGSITITAVSYYFPLKLNFDASGVATVPFYNFITSGGVTFDKSTGVVTNTDGTGYLAIELPNGGIDLSTIKRIDVTYTGEDDIWGSTDNRILASLEIPGVNTWQGSRYSCDYTSYSASSSSVSTIKWNAGGKTGGSLTITAIKFTSEFVSCAKAGETVLNTLPWNKIDGTGTGTPAWTMDGSSDTYYGSYDGGAKNYADLTDYSELRVYCKSNKDGFRAFFVTGESTNDTKSTSNATWHATEKYYSLDLSTVTKWEGKVALRIVKSDPWSGTPDQNVTNIVVYKTPAAGSAEYLITGKGLLDGATTALLANANVTSIDATGMTNVTATTLTSANPNCLFKANSGKLSNSKNVIVSGTCANLVLTDNKPFKAPKDFTATAVSYDRSFTEGNMTTVCLPFALNETEASTLGKFYKLSDVDESTLKFTEETEPEANKPYLVVPTDTKLTLSEANKSIAATPAATKSSKSNIEFIGTLAATGIPASEEPNNYYAFNNGVLVRIAENSATLPAFRAYIKATEVGGGVKAFTIQFDDATGVNSLPSMDVAASSKFNVQSSKIYNVAGQRMSKLQKGLNIVNGKKVMVK